MQWLERLNESLDYIEGNLEKGPVTAEAANSLLFCLSLSENVFLSGGGTPVGICTAQAYDQGGV